MYKFIIIKKGFGFEWSLVAPNNETILTSETYLSQAECENSIRVAKKMASKPDQFERLKDVRGASYFILKAPNGQTLARSETYLSEKSRDEALQNVINNAGIKDDKVEKQEQPGLIEFIKDRRKKAGLTQEELAEKAGVGIRFLRELEQGKDTLRLDKVNQVLRMFGHEMKPARIQKETE